MEEVDGIRPCWFLCVSPFSSRRAALQKYCTQPCLPKKVEGSPSGRPNLNGKLWMPDERSTDSPPEMENGEVQEEMSEDVGFTATANRAENK